MSGAAATGALIALHPFSARAAGNQAHLRIMETTDLHVAVLPYDYYADKPNDTMGLARTAGLIDGIRAEATNTMLVDNGDFLQGNPMGDFIAYERGMKDGDVHPVIKAMNTLGYACSTLGNHEFNYGLDFMFKVLHGANFPFVCANLTRGRLAGNPRDDDLFLKPYTIVDKTIRDGDGNDHTIRIGLIGLRAASDHDLGFEAPDRQGDGPRHRAGGTRLDSADAGGRRRRRRRPLPLRHRARARTREWRTHRSTSPPSTASTPS